MLGADFKIERKTEKWSVSGGRRMMNTYALPVLFLLAAAAVGMLV